MVPPGLQWKVQRPVLPRNVTQSASLLHATQVPTPIGSHQPDPPGPGMVVDVVLQSRPQTLPATQHTIGLPHATGRLGGQGSVQPP